MQQTFRDCQAPIFYLPARLAAAAAGASPEAQDNAEHRISYRQGNAAEQDKAAGATKLHDSKRKREDDPQSSQRQAKAQMRQPVGSSQDAKPDGPTDRIVLPQILTRAESVAADNGTPRGDDNPPAPSSELPHSSKVLNEYSCNLCLDGGRLKPGQI